MARRIVRLTVDHVSRLPGPGSTCLAWELDPVRRARVPVADRVGEKEAWVSEVLREWGSCGRVAMVDDELVGFCFYVPPAFAPGAAVWPTAPAAADCVLLTTAYVDPRWRGGGLGRMLVQGMARDLIKRGEVRPVEAFGDTRGHGDCGSGRCLLPADFLGGVGFKTQRAHPTTPRMRMELKSTLRLREEVEQALERLLGAVRPGTKRPAVDAPREADPR